MFLNIISKKILWKQETETEKTNYYNLWLIL